MRIEEKMKVVRLKLRLIVSTLMILLASVAVSPLPNPVVAEGSGRMGGGDGSLELLSTPSPAEVRRGETVTWNLTVKNPTSEPVENVSLKVTFDPPVEAVASSISPSSPSIFSFEEVGAESSITLAPLVRVPRSERIFPMSRTITGVGFVSVSEDYSTEDEAYEIRCEAAVWAERMEGLVENSSSIAVLGEAGAAVRVREMGSGEYSSQEAVRVDRGNGSIELSRNISAEHRPSGLDHLGEGYPNRTNLWFEMIDLLNDGAGEFSRLGHVNATILDRWYYAKLDGNGTILISGAGRLPSRLEDLEGSFQPAASHPSIQERGFA